MQTITRALSKEQLSNYFLKANQTERFAIDNANYTQSRKFYLASNKGLNPQSVKYLNKYFLTTKQHLNKELSLMKKQNSIT